MANALVAKLEQFTRLSAADKRTLDRLAGEKLRRLGAREDIISEGDRPETIKLILSGWACRYKQLKDGRRQILSYFVPGDLCDLQVYLLARMDHSIGTFTPVVFSEISRDTVMAVTSANLRIARALAWSGLVAEAIEREWIVSLGQRSAFERVSHLFCELFIRLRAVGLTAGNSCEWPITQAELGETTGLSSVHVNRTLQELRAANLIVLRGRTLTIPDFDRLQQAAMFSPDYLHLEHEGREFDANEP
jgi:CRP-like cAMP-binding protein